VLAKSSAVYHILMQQPNMIFERLYASQDLYLLLDWFPSYREISEVIDPLTNIESILELYINIKDTFIS